VVCLFRHAGSEQKGIALQNSRLSTSVVFIIFNRPDTTAQVFEAIRRAAPPRLLVVADGPRARHADDVEKCATARTTIERVDWDCEVLTNFAETNMGCKQRVSSGLDWVFEMVEEAIILEDDCLPHPTFFRFCEELLQEYRDDERIMAVAGNNFQFGRRRTQHSYYFSRYPHCWGWATWRRAWQHYDPKMALWPRIRDEGWLGSVLHNKREIAYWTRIFDLTYAGDIDSWAYAWTLACWVQHGLTILPSVNLVSNVGFGTQATHTGGSGRFANMKTYPVDFPLDHPSFILRDAKADRFTQHTHYEKRGPIQRIKRWTVIALRSIGVFETLHPLYAAVRQLFR
jgi:hypothetical protein